MAQCKAKLTHCHVALSSESEREVAAFWDPCCRSPAAPQLPGE